MTDVTTGASASDIRELTLTHSHNGRPVTVCFPQHYAWKGDQKPILIIGGVHGDEPEGVNLANSLRTYLESFSTKTSWLLIPCLNPDGYLSSPRERTNGAGVDLNRNFPTNDWVNTAKAPRYNPGPAPASEPEVRAVIELIRTQSPKLIIHLHSLDRPCVVYTSENAPSEAQILAQVSGYPLQSDIGYPTPGSLGEFGWSIHKTPVVCVEEREQEETESSWNRFRPAFEAILGAKNQGHQHAP